MSQVKITIGSSEFTKLVEKHIAKSKLWNNKRLYIHGVGYNTKKCKQTLYIDLFTFTLKGSTECDSQPDSWCSSQTDMLLDNQKLQAMCRLLRILCAERTSRLTVEEVMNEATLSVAPVKGYITEWRNVRVAINRFGKLADRNRNFINFISTNKADAPRHFVELSEAEYKACSDYYRGEKMMEPYTEPSEYILAALRYAESQAEKKSQN